MAASRSGDPTNPFSLGSNSADEESSADEDQPPVITVHNLTARFFFNRPAEELVPAQYLQMAERTSIVQDKPWIFCQDKVNARYVNLKRWPRSDIRYRGVFKTLARVPCIETGLWEGGSEECQQELLDSQSRAQAQVVYALLDEIGKMLDLKHLTADARRVFFLKPRLLVYQLEYWTGYRQKHRDGPETDAILSLEFNPGKSFVITILPISVTNYEEPLETALADKFKLMLGQLLQHIKPLPVPGDKIPDQEIFLIGQHGSKLHIMRTIFPGHKVSSLWCRRELPYETSLIPQTPPTCAPPPSPSQPEAPATPTEPTDDTDTAQTNPTSTTDTARHRRISNRFYAPENIARVRRHIEATKLSMLDQELDPRTFRVLCTREFDLWKEDDFAAAVQVLAGLHMYLLSGSARCGALQAVFNKPPYPPHDAEPEDTAEDVELDEEEVEEVKEEDEKEEAEQEEEGDVDLERSPNEYLCQDLNQQLDSLQNAVWERETTFQEREEAESCREESDSRGEDAKLLSQTEQSQELDDGRHGFLQELRRSWWNNLGTDAEAGDLEGIEGVEGCDEAGQEEGGEEQELREERIDDESDGTPI